MRTIKRQVPVQRTRRAMKAAALAGAVVLGGYVMAVSIGSANYAWLGWFSLVPLFLAIRQWRPVGAMLAGALWGVSLFVFSVAQPNTTIVANIGSFLLLAGIPAAYASLGAWLTRRIGFNPFVLGFAWMGVELALGPAGLRTGLLGAAPGDGTFLHWVSGAFGYVVVAFVVALVSASLVSALSAARFSAAPCRYPVLSSDREGRLSPQTIFCFPRFAIHPLHPPRPTDRALTRMRRLDIGKSESYEARNGPSVSSFKA